MENLSSDDLVCNSAQCLICKDVLISHHRHDFKWCECKFLAVDGGNDYAKRLLHEGAVVLFTSPDNPVSENFNTRFKELSIYSDAPFEVLREHIYRGSRGRNGLQPLKYIKLSEMSNEYLAVLIKFCHDKGQDEFNSQSYLKEYAYRVTNNIYIEE